MIIEFPVTGVPDLGSAIGVAQKQAMAAGFTHVSISSTRQVGRREWVIVLFVSDSNGATTQRSTPRLVEDGRPGVAHWHSSFNCPCGR
jgi:hypothetical protein